MIEKKELMRTIDIEMRKVVIILLGQKDYSFLKQ